MHLSGEMSVGVLPKPAGVLQTKLCSWRSSSNETVRMQAYSKWLSFLAMMSSVSGTHPIAGTALFRRLPPFPHSHPSIPAAAAESVYHHEASSLSPGITQSNGSPVLTAVPSGHFHKLTELYLPPLQNQYYSMLHFKVLAAKKYVLSFPHYPLSAAVSYN